MFCFSDYIIYYNCSSDRNATRASELTVDMIEATVCLVTALFSKFLQIFVLYPNVNVLNMQEYVGGESWKYNSWKYKMPERFRIFTHR